MTGTRITTINVNGAYRENGALSPPANTNGTQTQHHLNNHNNPNSGLRRFPSIGNTKKLSVENTTLRAKITELERYLTGLKEELILAHRQIHAKRLEVKIAEERKAVEIHELGQHIQRCEFELGAKVVECEGLQAQLEEKIKEQMAKVKQIDLLDAELREARGEHKNESSGQSPDDAEQQEQGDNAYQTPSDTTTIADGSVVQTDADEQDNDKVKTMPDENMRKDAQIKELLEKVDRLGSEMLNLEREKARLERPPTPSPDDDDASPTNTSTPKRRGSTLDDLVPITAEAIIAATTVHSASTDSTAQSDQDRPILGSTTESSTNSVGYNFAAEHPKLLAKYQALRMQHAQVSEYLDSLESENRDLKVQLLGVSSI
ncbi:hypothetical protein BG011_006999 [Mortierella polycephala]|uniref:Uncharacterized protein n=1 Tax=Mortierella polycephala TaxID=41804 RepID=A0A9P6PR97_9FUNG|nr:hypothetical protein BG011_006999 [Mortierella polycephala]